MGIIPRETIDEVRQRADLVEVIGRRAQLSKRGEDFWCCCPFHQEKTPSFKINPARQSYYCFGCGKHGNIFHFLMETENVTFPEAVRMLAGEVGVIIPERKPDSGGSENRGVSAANVRKLLGACMDWYHAQLSEPHGQVARSYLETRGLDADTTNRFRLGFAPDSWEATLNWADRQGFGEELVRAAGLVAEKEGDSGTRIYDRFRGRLMFPIWDDLGRPAGFNGRLLDSEAKAAKYVNSPDTLTFHKKRILYAFHLARPEFKTQGHALVCEGQLDVIACHRAGLTHAVAPQGTAFTDEQAQLIARHTDRVVFAFDADEAGRKAAVKSLEKAIENGLEVEVVTMPEGDDPDGIFREHGTEGLRQVMADRKDAFEYLYSVIGEKLDMSLPRSRQQVVDGMVDLIMKVPQPVTRDLLFQWLASRLSVTVDVIYEEARRKRRERQRANRYRRQYATSPPPFAPGTEAGGEIPKEEDTAGEVPSKALLDLLDLALHHESVAQELAANEHLTPDFLGESRVEKALLLVLEKTVEEEWDKAGFALSGEEDLVRDAVVGRLLQESRFSAPSTDKDSPGERERKERQISRAVRECLHAIEVGRLEEQRSELMRNLQSGLSPEEVGGVLEELRLIGRRIQALHPRKPPHRPLGRAQARSWPGAVQAQEVGGTP